MVVKYLVGPELFWMLLYAAAVAFAKSNTPASKAAEDFIQGSWFWIPACSLLLFALWWTPFGAKGVLLFLRIWIVGLIGCYLVTEKVISASAFQGPGAGMGLIGAICIQLFMLMVGSVAVGIKLLWFR